ncbi:Na+/H+ antiporter [Kitasatospora paracochleata]|uniref:Na+/H+ antiporter n=1 Tax=Kitasatospora paracochleata TaxID=58354 RepID=UPI0020A3167C|nr:Na+/H+ antiporter [Kitasatospora paracochleata]
MRAVGVVLFLVVLGTVVATGARRWRIPAPSLLVLAGVAVASIPGVPALHIAPQTIALVVLPPLLYASAEELSLRDLKTVWRPVTVLVFGLVLASAAMVGALAVALTPLHASMAFVLGAILASTDPVAVTALGRRLALPSRMQTLVQAESLFNDASSLVLFRVAVTVAVTSGAFSPLGAGGEFLRLAGGGLLVGTALGGVVIVIRRRTADPVLETVIALVTPYAAYVVAEQSHTSGVTAVVVAGVVLGRSGQRLSDARIRLQLHAVYGVVVFLLETVVFAVIGLELPALVRDLSPGTGWWPLQAITIAAALLALRVLWMLPVSSSLTPADARHSWPVAAVLTWAGTRGVMPLAAALSIPLVTDSGQALPGRPLVLVLTTAVVVLTLIAQGLTLAPLVSRSGIALEPEHTAREEAEARARLARTALAHLDAQSGSEITDELVLDRVRRALDARLQQADEAAHAPGGAGEAGTHLAAYTALRREVLAIQSTELRRLYDEHEISDTTRREIQHDLDQQEIALTDDAR